MKILAVVPAYNEEESLLDTIKELKSICPEVDCLVVNDGSTDSTERLCRKARINHLSLPVNCGLAGAFQAGMKYAKKAGYDAVVQFDADGQHRPEYIPKMAEVMSAQDADVVIASRYMEADKPTDSRGIGSRLISRLIKLTTGTTITDPTSGMRMFNRELIALFATGFDMAPEPDTIAWLARKGWTIIEIPAQMRERQAGESYFTLSQVVAYMARTCMSILLFQWLR